jgi:hypothetical protein
MKLASRSWDGKRINWFETILIWSLILFTAVFLALFILALATGNCCAPRESPASRIRTGPGVFCEDRTDVTYTSHYDATLKQTTTTPVFTPYIYCGRG